MKNASMLWLLVLGAALAWCAATVTTPGPGSSATVAVRPADLAKQKERERAIQELIRERVFYRTEQRGGGLPRIWVQPRFYTLPFDDKEALLAIVWAYHFDGAPPSAGNILRVLDARTDKEVGRFTRAELKLY